MYLGIIADDVTGGTDLASRLGRGGKYVVQSVGIPSSVPDCDAMVISLKTRTAASAVAVEQSCAAASLLTSEQAHTIYFKYCSTFDSTAQGNIGPVIEALQKQLNAPFTAACPSYPELARTVYLGHLFVGRDLLSESSMRDHPLTPMRDSNIVRVLEAQYHHPVRLIPLNTVETGVDSVSSGFESAAAEGAGVAIVDAINDRHIETIAQACRKMPLVTGGAALGGALAKNEASKVRGSGRTPRPEMGRAVVLSGSCSQATLGQIEWASDKIPCRAVDPIAILENARETDDLLEWTLDQLGSSSAMLFSSSPPKKLRDVKAQLGDDSAALVESTFAKIARGLADRGVRTFIIAGGETSGAVLEALKVRMLGFGSEIEPGIPWTFSLEPHGYHLALKSGNFGSRQFFGKALEINR